MYHPRVADASESPPRVLVAEDDRVTRELVGGLLRGHGFAVELYETASPIAERVTRGDVDLVILDVVLPGMNGLQACRLIKSVAGDGFVPVILVTSKSDTESRVEGLRIGADDYVVKPLDERELLARVNAMLRIKRGHDEVVRAKRRLEELAVRDELTGLFNFRYLHSRIHEEFKRAQRHREPLACAMVDVDHFKRVNDGHGHDVGDALLVEVAERLKGALRETDVVTRYGGDEFLVMLPSTHFSGAITVAERIWDAVRSRPVRAMAGRDRVELNATISMGLALFPSRDVGSSKDLLRAADQALYQAKREGRDRICVFQHQGYIYRPVR